MDEESLKTLGLLIDAIPELLGAFIVINVQYYNLTGKHIGQPKK